jgi:hypothetical protein
VDIVRINSNPLQRFEGGVDQTKQPWGLELVEGIGACAREAALARRKLAYADYYCENGRLVGKIVIQENPWLAPWAPPGSMTVKHTAVQKVWF